MTFFDCLCFCTATQSLRNNFFNLWSDPNLIRSLFDTLTPHNKKRLLRGLIPIQLSTEFKTRNLNLSEFIDMRNKGFYAFILDTIEKISVVFPPTLSLNKRKPDVNTNDAAPKKHRPNA